MFHQDCFQKRWKCIYLPETCAKSIRFAINTSRSRFKYHRIFAARFVCRLNNKSVVHFSFTTKPVNRPKCHQTSQSERSHAIALLNRFLLRSKLAHPVLVMMTTPATTATDGSVLKYKEYLASPPNVVVVASFRYQPATIRYCIAASVKTSHSLLGSSFPSPVLLNHTVLAGWYGGDWGPDGGNARRKQLTTKPNTQQS